MAHPIPEHSILQAGQALRLRAPRGMQLVAVRGRLLVELAPVWIGEQVLRPSLDLREGEAQQLSESGWITIHAHSACELVCVLPAPRRSLWRALLARLPHGCTASLRQEIG